MACYNFTYKDVLKRYERIINKPSKFELRLLATILLIITIVNITSLCFAAESEEVPSSSVGQLTMSIGSNFFSSDSSHTIYYASIEKGYIYTFTNTTQFNILIAFSNDIPGVNVPYYDIMNVEPGGTYTFISNDYDYLYFNDRDAQMVLTRERIEGYQGAVSDLVDNVGISQIWDVFDTGIGFVGVVVLAAFGIFLVVIAIRKMQKGKSDF